MKTIKIAGVPEHFNLPWHLCIENGEFEEAGIDLQWTDVPEGTGKMCEMLRDGATDLVVILTEGIVRDIENGNPSMIVQEYVSSPLLWGIHVAHKSPYQTTDELQSTKAAISRKGSGSHLMAVVHAKQKGWNPEQLHYEIVNTIDGAVESLQNQKSDYFMWEQFMTQPLVDQNIFRRLDTFPTPWPCFVIVARKEWLQHEIRTLRYVLKIINRTTSEFKSIPSIDRTLASRYHQKLEDIQSWLSKTVWSQKNLKEETLNKVQNELMSLSLIHKKSTFAEMVYQ
jgi:ABC-type nitrate/sulfonate/bicarbonate transport system substrate-binding protein